MDYPHDIRQTFARHGLRCTRQRELIYAALAATKMHPTADELFETVRRDEPGLSLATVYNTLDAFARRGLCRRLPGASGGAPCHFDADHSDHVHVTMPDGRVIDAPPELSERILRPLTDDLLDDLERRLGVRVGGINIQIICEPEADSNGQGRDLH